jgi:hypothetical protein
MRLWSIHPQYLDSRGLVALWREALLAQHVLAGLTTGYRHHPQLERFRAHEDPEAAIASYLRAVRDEAERRGYQFDAAKIRTPRDASPIDVASGQLQFEWAHLAAKLEARDPAVATANATVDEPAAHPLFRVVTGPAASWERIPTQLLLTPRSAPPVT